MMATNELKKTEFTKICRLCLSYNKAMSNIFTAIEGASLIERIKTLASVEISQGDGLPDSICGDCQVKLEDCIKFRQEIENSHIFLLTIAETTADINTTLENPNKKINIISDTLVKTSDVLGFDLLTQNCSNIIENAIEDFYILEVPRRSDSAPTKDAAVDVSNADVDGFDDLMQFLKNQSLIDYNKLQNDIRRLKTNIVPDDKRDAKKLWDKLAQKGIIMMNPSGVAPRVKQEKIEASESPLEVSHFEQLVRHDVQTESAWRITELHAMPTNMRVFVCHLCLQSFETHDISTIETHASEHFKHTDRSVLMFQNAPPFKCEICADAFVTRQSFVIHQRLHLKIYPFKCKTCTKCFASQDRLERHLMDHIKSEREPSVPENEITRDKVSCSMCPRVFVSKASLRVHEKRHSGGKHKCEYCTKSFYLDAHRLRHERSAHTGVKEQACYECGKAFHTKPELVRHLKYHAKDKQFSCAVCNKDFYESGHLKLHMRSHTKDYPYICDCCGKATPTLSKLKRHLKTHDKNQTYRRLNLSESNGESYIIVTESDAGEMDQVIVKTDSDDVQMYTDESGAFYVVNDKFAKSGNGNTVLM